MKDMDDIARTASRLGEQFVAAIIAVAEAKGASGGGSPGLKCQQWGGQIESLEGLKDTLESTESTFGLDLSEAKSIAGKALSDVKGKYDALCT